MATDTLQREAIAWIAAHPTAFLELSMKKAIYFWEPPFHKGKYQVSRYEPVIRLIWAIQYIALLVGTLGTLAVPGPRDRRMAVLWLALASYTSVFMVFYVITRYREPIMPVLWVMAAIAVEAAYRQWWLREGSSRARLGREHSGQARRAWGVTARHEGAAPEPNRILLRGPRAEPCSLRQEICPP